MSALKSFLEGYVSHPKGSTMDKHDRRQGLGHGLLLGCVGTIVVGVLMFVGGHRIGARSLGPDAAVLSLSIDGLPPTLLPEPERSQYAAFARRLDEFSQTSPSGFFAGPWPSVSISLGIVVLLGVFGCIWTPRQTGGYEELVEGTILDPSNDLDTTFHSLMTPPRDPRR